MELQTTDSLRIIADVCLIKSNSTRRVEIAERIIQSIQSELNIPEKYEAAVAILSVLFNISRINGIVPFHRFKLKMGLNWI